MKTAVALLLSLAISAAPAAELKLGNGQSIVYEELIVTADAPMTFVTAKNKGEMKVYKASEIDIEHLPEAERTKVKDYIQAQLQKRMILKDDKWIHRDEMLLNADKRYGRKGKLAKVGGSLINFKNTTGRMVTIGIRSGDKGYEMHIEDGKKKGYQVPDGEIYYVFALESEDGTQLIVQKSEVQKMKNMHLEVTIYKSSEMPQNEVGSIDIPEMYQVKP